MKKPIPVLRTDEEAEAFLIEADLSEYDLSAFVPLRVHVDPLATSPEREPQTKTD